MSDVEDDIEVNLLGACSGIGLWSTFMYPNRKFQEVRLRYNGSRRWYKASVVMFDPYEPVCMRVRWWDRSETRYTREDVMNLIKDQHIAVVTFYV